MKYIKLFENANIITADEIYDLFLELIDDDVLNADDILLNCLKGDLVIYTDSLKKVLDKEAKFKENEDIEVQIYFAEKRIKSKESDLIEYLTKNIIRPIEEKGKLYGIRSSIDKIDLSIGYISLILIKD